jgi:hypothetical protein
MSVVVVPCCGYSLKRITILLQRMASKARRSYLILELVFINICPPCWHLHSLLDDDNSSVISSLIFIYV